jgi:hypothetical protein
VLAAAFLLALSRPSKSEGQASRARLIVKLSHDAVPATGCANYKIGLPCRNPDCWSVSIDGKQRPCSETKEAITDAIAGLKSQGAGSAGASPGQGLVVVLVEPTAPFFLVKRILTACDELNLPRTYVRQFKGSFKGVKEVVVSLEAEPNGSVVHRFVQGAPMNSSDDLSSALTSVTSSSTAADGFVSIVRLEVSAFCCWSAVDGAIEECRMAGLSAIDVIRADSK